MADVLIRSPERIPRRNVLSRCKPRMSCVISARRARWTACRSRCARVRSMRSWGPTGRGRPRSSGRSQASSSQARARSGLEGSHRTSWDTAATGNCSDSSRRGSLVLPACLWTREPGLLRPALRAQEAESVREGVGMPARCRSGGSCATGWASTPTACRSAFRWPVVAERPSGPVRRRGDPRPGSEGAAESRI